ncbi:bacillithiol biosynthesis cysteine-adding enzyme BshC [Flavobacterium stagni]|uniref:Putative cysteine ligase BshC n=1 Tax=Flavobacterium stagni TaxID=2506421 RepID=A0A4Q1K9Y7_9FLAO|nr:bacillithiol biosynthesis cysteine-adding enzyme BshC [Flavobacterium stagni]RXR23321.1 bacillithiol biosynthesis cysteine-adding enzyme BshC [Flavobacterium stagni]
MDTDCIDYRSLHQFSSLIKDYLDQNPKVQSWYNRYPNLENFKAQLVEKSANYPSEFRSVLVAELKDQFRGFEISEKTKVNLDSLHSSTTFSVTTGHQLNLFTGPVYFIYKIVSVINLCNELKKTYPEHDFVPVYWMATEDHDFEEIQSFRFQNTKITWNTPQTGAVGRFLIDDTFEPTRETFYAQIPSGERGDFLRELFNAAYQKGRTLAEATRHLVHSLFDEHGLVIIDGDAHSLKKAFVPFVLQEIREQVSNLAVQKTIQEFAPYKVQVNPRETNLFYLAEGIRERIVVEKNNVSILNTALQFSLAEFESMIQNNPQCISPNVLLRPLYQEIILPNLAYIGGGGEIAYWLELKTMFSQFKVTFPLLMLRNSVVNVTQKQEQKRQKLAVSYEELFNTQEQLQISSTQRLSSLNFDFESQKQFLKDQFESLYQLALQTDKSFVGAVKAQEQKQIKGLENLQKRMIRAEKRVHSEQLERIIALQNELFPNQGLQERSANFSTFYMEFGPVWMERLLQELNPLESCFSVFIFD